MLEQSVHTCLKLKQRSQVCEIHIIIVIVTGLWVVLHKKYLVHAETSVCCKTGTSSCDLENKADPESHQSKGYMEPRNSSVPSFSKES